MALTFLNVGTSGSEFIPGVLSADNVSFALGGNDTVETGIGDDLTFGQEGNDVLQAGGGNDTLFGGTGNDRLEAGSGNDRLAVEVGFSSFGTDTLIGGSGFDSVVFETASIIVVNGNPGPPNIFPASQGVLVNLINAFAPGTVRDVGASSFDADGTLITDISAAQRGRIVDGTAQASTFADIETFQLTSFGDIFLDASGSHLIEGGGGNDFISGGGGADNIDGGAGRDTAVYRFSTSGVNVVLLDLGSGGSGSRGEAAGDRLFSIENAFGSDFNDNLIGDGNANLLKGFVGNDTLTGGVGADTLAGGAGSDRAAAGSDADTLQGETGNDTLDGGSGNDSIDGGAGSDTALLQSWNSLSSFGFVRGTVTLADGAGAGSAVISRTLGIGITTELERETLRSIENVVGSNFIETMTGNSSANRFEGLGGADVLNGGLGNDTLLGGDGNDRLTGGPGALLNLPAVLAPDSDVLEGGAGNDTVDYAGSNGFVVVTLGQDGADGSTTEFVPVAPGNPALIPGSSDILRSVENAIGSSFNDAIIGNQGNNLLLGGGGNDTLAGGLGDDTLDGGSAFNTAAFGGVNAAVVVDLAAGTASGQGSDKLIDIGSVVGSSAGDTILGSAGGEALDGGGGNDSLAGLNGADTLKGGEGADALDGAGGTDTAVYSGSAAKVFVNLLTGVTGGGDAAGDVLAGIENLTGSSQGDTLTGNGDANRLEGSGGDDLLIGAAGTDTLIGGAGADTLTGAAGADSLLGGAGSDTFDFNAPAQSAPSGRDSVADFEAGDFIDLLNIDAAEGVAGNQAFEFIGSALFTGQAGELRFFVEGENSFIAGDVNGDANADFEIIVIGVTTFAATDFIL